MDLGVRTPPRPRHLGPTESRRPPTRLLVSSIVQLHLYTCNLVSHCRRNTTFLPSRHVQPVPLQKEEEKSLKYY